MKITRVTSVRRASGPLFCPRCCWKLGRAESPAIGYLSRCGGCKRKLRIVDIEGGGVAVQVSPDPRDYEPTDDCEYLDI